MSKEILEVWDKTVREKMSKEERKEAADKFVKHLRLKGETSELAKSIIVDNYKLNTFEDFNNVGIILLRIKSSAHEFPVITGRQIKEEK